MASSYLPKMSFFRSPPDSSSAASALATSWTTADPDVENLSSSERAALSTLATAAAPILERAAAASAIASPPAPPDDLLRCAAASPVERDTLLLTFLRDAGGDVSAAAVALEATLRWRAKRRVSAVPAAAVDVADATFPAYLLGPACDDPAPGGGGGLLAYAALAQFERKTVRRAALLDAVIAACEGIFYRDPPAAAATAGGGAALPPPAPLAGAACASAPSIPGGGASAVAGRRRRHTPIVGGRHSRRFTVIMDFTDWSATRNVDLPVFREVIKLFFTHYPERHGRFYLVNYPLSVYAVYKLLVPLLGARVIREIRWVPATGEGVVPVLRREVGAARLPRWLGGDVDEPLPVGVDAATLGVFQVPPQEGAGAA
ncbi:hypothetical protein MMPV_007975 [Pyropia vietnamensis]